VTRSRIAWFLVSAGLALLLVLGLLRVGRLDLGKIAGMIASVRSLPLLAITLLLCINSFLGGEKWRIVVLQVDPPTGRALPRSLYFALSAVGVGLGQLLPAQVSMALCRWLGSRAFGGRPVMRGIGATLIEQLFDVVAAALIALPTIVVLVSGAGARAWAAMAVAAAIAGWLLCGVGEGLVASIARLAAQVDATWRGGTMLSRLAASGVVAAAVTRPLLLLSLLRIAVLTLISAVSAAAVGLDIPFWQLGAAFPFGMFGTALSLTPGGIGASEWGLVSVLAGLGTPMQMAVQWAIACRLLVMFAAVIGAVVGVLLAVSRQHPAML